MISIAKPDAKRVEKQCAASLLALEDTLYVIGGKWKLMIITALRDKGHMRFNELQRTITGISARVLSNELKELEMNGFINRNVYTKTPVVVEYELTGYSDTLHDVLCAMVQWGTMHRNKIKREAKNGRSGRE
ncbi:MAG TPA: helix-turn-helix domain-containing protein [Chitinophagaceae bacterium]|nr:helix-turn-helix domain-containing protein [Chitinophagaceae bacterium]